MTEEVKRAKGVKAWVKASGRKLGENESRTDYIKGTLLPLAMQRTDWPDGIVPSENSLTQVHMSVFPKGTSRNKGGSKSKANLSIAQLAQRIQKVTNELATMKANLQKAVEKL